MDDKARICPICGRKYNNYPAISRADNKTEICPDCGVREALMDFGIALGGERSENNEI